MKGGMEFADDTPPKLGDLSLCIGGKKKLQYKQKEVETHLKTEGNVPLRFTLYNIESFNKYENDTFDLSKFDEGMKDINSIEHLYLCGFLKKFFIKKNKEGEEDNKDAHFEAIGKVLKKLCSDGGIKDSEKIQIILAHSTEKKALCIIFNMSNINSKYYDLLKKSLPKTLFSDEKILEGKIEKIQLENLIEFTNEKLEIEPITLGKISDIESYTNSVDNITEFDNILKIIDFFKKLKEKLGGEVQTEQYKYVDEYLILLQSLKNNIEAGENRKRVDLIQVSYTNNYEYIEQLLKENISYDKLILKIEPAIIIQVFADNKSEIRVVLETKIKADMSRDDMINKFGDTAFKEALNAAELNETEYDRIMGNLATNSSGGGKKNKLIRGGGLTRDDLKKINRLLESLKHSNEKTNQMTHTQTLTQMLNLLKIK